MSSRSMGPKAAIVAGLRTPFVKSGTTFQKVSPTHLASYVCNELILRLELAPHQLDRVVFGQVVVSPQTPNVAREIVLGLDWPRHIDAYSVSRACATGTQAIVEGAMAIAQGDAEVVLCGGVDSLSRPPITYQDKLIDALMKAQSSKDTLSKLRAFLKLKMVDFIPKPPSLREASTQLTMGESAEKMAKDNHIDRTAQDELALRSHQRAFKAIEQNIIAQEICHVYVPPFTAEAVTGDQLVRGQTDIHTLAQLKPVFDKRYGSITAGNSSPLTDGAACLLLVSEEKLNALHLQPLAWVEGYAFAAVDPAWQLLMAPGLAIPKLLDKLEKTLNDVDVVDMHEAFAAQVLSNLMALASDEWQQTYAHRRQAVGDISADKLNIYGGSIALGHPFAATGIRQATTMAYELQRRGHGRALISQCAAGGLGAALMLQR